MKKITYLIISIIFLNFINACGGYKPIYTTKNLQFKIVDYSIKSNNKLGRQIYYKLHNLFKSSNNNEEAQSITITIDIQKNKEATTKDSSGKTLEYKIILNSNIVINDYLTNDEILDKIFSYSVTYKVQDQLFETKELENQTIENLIDKTYQDLLIKLSQNLS